MDSSSHRHPLRGAKIASQQVGASSGGGKTPSTTTATKVKKSLPSLCNIFQYLDETILMIEMKTGLCYLGTLLSSNSTSDMNLILVNVIVIPSSGAAVAVGVPHTTSVSTHSDNYKLLRYYYQTISVYNNNNGNNSSNTIVTDINCNNEKEQAVPAPTSVRHQQLPVPPLLQMVHIRGSKVRYIHFIDCDNHNNKNRSINHMVQVGVHRERNASKRYQRGIRKTTTTTTNITERKS